MIPNVLSLLILLWSTTSVNSWRACNTTVAVRQGLTNDSGDSIALGVNSYKELIEKSKMFVDNSGFVEDVIRGKCKSMLMVGPKKWCRTITLDTLKTFVEIEVDEEGNEILPKDITQNFKLFRYGKLVLDKKRVLKLERPPLVADFPEVLRYDQGQNPAIYISFKDVTGKDYQEIEYALGRSIRRAYTQHSYMIKALEKLSANESYFYRHKAENKLKKFKEILNSEQLDKDSIRFLCKVLNEHFSREALVLMDDYDMPLMNTLLVPDFPDKDVIKILQIMEYLTGTTFKNNKHLFQGIAMGSVRLALVSTYPMWSQYAYRDITYAMMPVTDYFAFNSGDVRKLLHKHNITGDLFDEVTKWYGGYENKYTCFERAFHPYSLVKYLKHRKVVSYWEPDEEENYYRKCIEQQPYLRNLFLKLLSRMLIPVTQIPELGEEEFIGLKSLAVERSDDIHILNMFFCYLFRRGYLTTDVYRLNNFIFTDPLKASNYPIRVPNREIAFVLTNWMISYYVNRYKIQHPHIQNAADSLFQLIKDDSYDKKLLENSLTTLYKNNEASFFEANETTTEEDEMLQGEDSAHGIFSCVTLKMHMDLRFDIDIIYNGIYKADTVVAYNQTQQLIIFELRYTDEPVQSILNLAQRREVIIKKRLKYLKTTKFVGIRVTPEKTVDVSVLLKEEDF